MRPRLHPLTYAELGAAYLISRQAAAGLILRHGYATVADPEKLFVHLLENGKAGKLRTRLSDPSFRAAAAQQLAALARP